MCLNVQWKNTLNAVSRCVCWAGYVSIPAPHVEIECDVLKFGEQKPRPLKKWDTSITTQTCQPTAEHSDTDHEH